MSVFNFMFLALHSLHPSPGPGITKQLLHLDKVNNHGFFLIYDHMLVGKVSSTIVPRNPRQEMKREREKERGEKGKGKEKGKRRERERNY